MFILDGTSISTTNRSGALRNANNLFTTGDSLEGIVGIGTSGDGQVEGGGLAFALLATGKATFENLSEKLTQYRAFDTQFGNSDGKYSKNELELFELQQVGDTTTTLPQLAELDQRFAHYDHDRNGTIDDLTAFKDGYHELNPTEPELTDQQATGLMAEMDAVENGGNGNGVVEEFEYDAFKLNNQGQPGDNTQHGVTITDLFQNDPSGAITALFMIMFLRPDLLPQFFGQSQGDEQGLDIAGEDGKLDLEKLNRVIFGSPSTSSNQTTTGGGVGSG